MYSKRTYEGMVTPLPESIWLVRNLGAGYTEFLRRWVLNSLSSALQKNPEMPGQPQVHCVCNINYWSVGQPEIIWAEPNNESSLRISLAHPIPYEKCIKQKQTLQLIHLTLYRAMWKEIDKPVGAPINKSTGLLSRCPIKWKGATYTEHLTRWVNY